MAEIARHRFELRRGRGALAIVVPLMLCLAGWGSVRAQEADAPGERTFRTTGSRIAIGHNIEIARDEEVREGVVVIGGSARIDGRVRNDVFVAGGDVTLGPDAEVRGDIMLVGGVLRRAPGARFSGSVSYVSFGDWRRDWAARAGWPRIDGVDFWSWLGLAATTARVAVLFILMAGVLLVARARVARVGRAAAAEPGRAFLVGLAAEVLFVPLLILTSVVLAVTIIGIPLVAVLVPLAVLTALAALLLGFTALACRLGERIEDALGLRVPSAVVATAIGFLIIVGPAVAARLLGVATASLGTVALALLAAGAIVEFGAWTVGLGATLMTGFGRWSTTPPPLPMGSGREM